MGNVGGRAGRHGSSEYALATSRAQNGHSPSVSLPSTFTSHCWLHKTRGHNSPKADSGTSCLCSILACFYLQNT